VQGLIVFPNGRSLRESELRQNERLAATIFPSGDTLEATLRWPVFEPDRRKCLVASFGIDALRAGLPQLVQIDLSGVRSPRRCDQGASSRVDDLGIRSLAINFESDLFL